MSKMCDFRVFFIIERVFIKGIHIKIKTTFASITIPNYAFSKKNNYNFFKTTSTASHENRRFLENKKVLQCKNPLTAIPEILFFSAFRSENTPTVSHQKI